MPRRYKRRRTGRRKYRYKKYKTISNTGSVARPFGQSQMARHRYATDFTLNPGVGGTTAARIFSANGLYDPDVTGTGHQPLGFDQMQALFNEYLVLGSKIQLKMWNSSTATALQFVGVRHSNSTTVSGTYTDLVENGAMKYRNLTPVSAGGKSYAMIVHQCNPGKMQGVKDLRDEVSLRGVGNTNPSSEYYWQIFAGATAGQDTGPVYCQVVLEYIALWMIPQNVAQS